MTALRLPQHGRYAHSPLPQRPIYEWPGGARLAVMAAYCAERPARHHGLDGRKGAIAPGKDADLLVLEPGRFTFDERQVEDRPELRWSPYHGRPLCARVAATLLRGQVAWNGQTVLAAPGTGRFIKRGAP